MAKRIKKPPVEPKVGREWFRRYEEDGESALQIAKKEHYDPRTVRRQIEIEREKRELKEARVLVLRQAVEQHYQDLYSFAHKLVSELNEEGDSLWSMKNGYMWSALKEHLPRSPIWKNLDKWENTQNQIKLLREHLISFLDGLIQPDSLLNSTPIIIQGVKPVKDLLSAAILNSSFLQKQDFKVTDSCFTYSRKDGKSTDIELNSFFIARVPNEKVDEFMAELVDTINRIIATPEYIQMRSLVLEREKAHDIIQNELMIIIFRRVVPGKCKFCPI
jgi:hypothetical protein